MDPTLQSRVAARAGVAGWLLALALLACVTGPSRAAEQPDPAIEKSLEFILQGDYKAARKTLEARLKAAPNDVEARLSLAQLFLIEEEKFDEAVVQAETAVSFDSRSARCNRWLAHALAKKVEACERIEDAVAPAKRGFTALERALTLDPADDKARSFAVLTYLVAPEAVGGDPEKALAHARILAKQSGPTGHAMVAVCIDQKEGHPGKGREYLESLAATDPSLAANAMAYFLVLTGDHAGAADACRAMLEKDPDDVVAHYRLGAVLEFSGQDLETAVASLQRFLAAPPAPGPSMPTPAQAHCSLGIIYQQQGQREPALAELRQAVRLEPERVEFRRELRKVLKGK